MDRASQRVGQALYVDSERGVGIYNKLNRYASDHLSLHSAPGDFIEQEVKNWYIITVSSKFLCISIGSMAPLHSV